MNKEHYDMIRRGVAEWNKWYAKTLETADLRGADLQNMDLRGIDLRGADLRGANLSGSVLCGANFGVKKSEGDKDNG